MSEKPAKLPEFFWEAIIDNALNRDTEKHIAEQREALEANPLDPRSCFHLGLLYTMQRKPQAAIEMFERVLAVDPGFSLAHRHLGQLYAVLGNFARAWAHAHEAAALGDSSLLDMLNRYANVTHRWR